MGSNTQFSLRWNDYLKHITCAFDSLRNDEDLVDVTLSCEGKRIRAHKILLSACSTYFKDLFKENPCKHPVIIFRNVKFEDLVALIDFMYQGEVNVVQEQLSSFLMTAEMLAVQGLSGSDKDSDGEKEDEINDEQPSVNRSQSSKEHERGTSMLVASSDKVSNLSSNSVKRKKMGNGADNISKVSRSHETKRMKSAKAEPADGSSEPVEVIVPMLKLEIPEEYIIDDSESGDYNDANKTESDEVLSQIVLHEVDNKKNRNDSEIYVEAQDSSTSMNIVDLGHILAKPGPSGEPQNQDNVQDYEYTSMCYPEAILGLNFYKCHMCDKSYKNRSSLNKHRAVHEGKTSCPLCNKIFSRSLHVKRHLRNKHGVQQGISVIPMNLEKMK